MTSRHAINLLVTGAIGLAPLLGACTPTVVSHGYRLDPAKVAAIEPGRSSREEVQRLLGSPSSTTTFDGNRWYYISQKEEHSSFYRQELVAQDVVTITFDQHGIVQAVDKVGLDQAQDIRPDKDKTQTAGNEISLLQQIFGNIGRFNSGESEQAGRGGAPGR